MFTTPTLVYVVWEDACGLDTEKTWVEAGEKQEYVPCLMHTVGWVLHQGDDGLILTPTVSADVMAPRDQIPRGMIRSVTILRKAKVLKA